MLISDLCFENLDCEFVNTLLKKSQKYKKNSKQRKKLLLISEHFEIIKDDFNKRIVTPENINLIIELFDCLLIKNVIEFIYSYAIPTMTPYVFNDVNNRKYMLPSYMCGNINMDNIALSGHLSFLKFGHENGYKCTNNTVNLTLYHNNYKCLKYLKSINCYIDKEAINIATNNNDMKSLKFLLDIQKLDKQFPLSDTAYKCAMIHDNIEAYKLLKAYDCPTYDRICIDAVINNSINCFKYIYENSGNNDKEKIKNMKWIIIHACQSNSIDCLTYALENGFIIDKEALVIAEENNNVECYKKLIL